MKKVLFSAKAKEQIQKLDPPIKKRVFNKIHALEEEKVQGVQLKQPLQNYKKIRVGNYRILFQERDKKLIIFVVSVAHRRMVYR